MVLGVLQGAHGIIAADASVEAVEAAGVYQVQHVGQGTLNEALRVVAVYFGVQLHQLAADWVPVVNVRGVVRVVEEIVVPTLGSDAAAHDPRADGALHEILIAGNVTYGFDEFAPVAAVRA